MYKMATGEHIFGLSESMEKTIHAQTMKDYRDFIYSNPNKELLQKHLKQVDEKIGNEELRNLIKSCLTAKNHGYKKIQRMFEESSRCRAPEY